VLEGKGNDYIVEQFATKTAERHWQLYYLGDTANRHVHSKVMLGEQFDFGANPDSFSYTKIPSARVAEFFSDVGDRNFARTNETVYSFSFIWRGISDAVTQEFKEKIAGERHRNPFILRTEGVFDEVIDSLIDIIVFMPEPPEFEQVFDDYNEIRIECLEVLG